MRKIILVSATPLEHGGLFDLNGVPIFQVGIGKTNSAMNMTEVILKEKPDLVVNFGSCGNLKDFKVGEQYKVDTKWNNFSGEYYRVKGDEFYHDILTSNCKLIN